MDISVSLLSHMKIKIMITDRLTKLSMTTHYLPDTE